MIRKKPLPVPDDQARVSAEALDTPVAARQLDEAARGAKTACILICDITWPVPNWLFLKPIIDRLTSAGVPQSGIT